MTSLAEAPVAGLRGAQEGGSPPPKGISEESLRAVVAAVRAGGGMSAAEVAAALGVSRVTARRYLEHLVVTGLVHRGARYQGAGRPELEYTWPDEGGGDG